MFRVLSLNGEPRNVLLASEPDGVPVVTDDFGCSWHVAEFDVEDALVVEAASTVVETAEPAKPVKRERKPKQPIGVDKDKPRADALRDAAIENDEAPAETVVE